MGFDTTFCGTSFLLLFKQQIAQTSQRRLLCFLSASARRSSLNIGEWPVCIAASLLHRDFWFEALQCSKVLHETLHLRHFLLRVFIIEITLDIACYAILNYIVECYIDSFKPVVWSWFHHNAKYGNLSLISLASPQNTADIAPAKRRMADLWRGCDWVRVYDTERLLPWQNMRFDSSHSKIFRVCCFGYVVLDIWRFPKSWGYPQLLYIFEGFSIRNIQKPSTWGCLGTQHSMRSMWRHHPAGPWRSTWNFESGHRGHRGHRGLGTSELRAMPEDVFRKAMKNHLNLRQFKIQAGKTMRKWQTNLRTREHPRTLHARWRMPSAGDESQHVAALWVSRCETQDTAIRRWVEPLEQSLWNFLINWENWLNYLLKYLAQIV